MKINNVEKFTNEVVRNLKDFYIRGVEIGYLCECVFYDNSKMMLEVTRLYNVLSINISGYSFYLEFTFDGVTMWKCDNECKCYRLIEYFDPNEYKNKNLFYMDLTKFIIELKYNIENN